jgi:hypothetical protein
MYNVIMIVSSIIHVFIHCSVSILYLYVAASIAGISTNFNIGFGSFVDKRLGPYVNLRPEVQEDPCVDNPSFSNCVSTYSYRHVVTLTKEEELFNVG